MQVRNLGAISSASKVKVNLAPRVRRDRAEIAYLNPSHLEALQADGGRRALPGDNQNAWDRWVATISASMAVCGAREFQARFGASFARGRQASRVDPMRHTLPYSLRSSPPSDPGHSDYLRGVLCAVVEPYYPSAPSAALISSISQKCLYRCRRWFIFLLYSIVLYTRTSTRFTLRYGLGLGCMRVTTSSNCKL